MAKTGLPSRFGRWRHHLRTELSLSRATSRSRAFEAALQSTEAAQSRGVLLFGDRVSRSSSRSCLESAHSNDDHCDVRVQVESGSRQQAH